MRYFPLNAWTREKEEGTGGPLESQWMWMEVYRRLRAESTRLCSRLELEDYVVQPFPWVSPPKWHLGHTTWFFEVFCLRERGFQSPNAHFDHVFNSYYESQGARVPQARRGVLSRPTVKDVIAYRQSVDAAMEKALAGGDPTLARALEVGIHHEQQHQELLLMDIKAILFEQPGRPSLFAREDGRSLEPVAEDWWALPEGLYEIGATEAGFAFDNERGRHRVLLPGARVRRTLVTNGEYLEFLRDNGYRRPELWLSDGWCWLQTDKVQAPLYWSERDGTWFEFTLGGERELDLDSPVCHVSHYEADAFARWAGYRLPTEFEWEALAARETLENADLFVPGSQATAPRGNRACLSGSVWQWTSSAYLPYPGFRPFEGAMGEYNGKFMSSQMVLRGGCWATPRDHYRTSYRNFFPPSSRWAFTGIRLAI